MSKISRYDRFNEYIDEIRPNPNEILITNHYWDFAEFNFEQETQIPRMYFHMQLGQPIELETSKGERSQIVNLDSNILLMKILPKQYRLYKALSFEKLQEEYIDWYIEKTKWK